MVWEQHDFSHLWAEIEQTTAEYGKYRVRKRDWVAEKRSLDALLSNIQTKLKTYRLPKYYPPENVDLAWLDKNQRIFYRRMLDAINRFLIDLTYRVRMKMAADYEAEAKELQDIINQTSSRISQLEDSDLSAQLATVKRLEKKTHSLEAMLNRLKKKEAECIKAGIGLELFTSTEDLEFDFQQIKMVIRRKIGFIENQVIVRNLLFADNCTRKREAYSTAIGGIRIEFPVLRH